MSSSTETINCSQCSCNDGDFCYALNTQVEPEDANQCMAFRGKDGYSPRYCRRAASVGCMAESMVFRVGSAGPCTDVSFVVPITDENGFLLMKHFHRHDKAMQFAEEYLREMVKWGE